MGLARGQDKYNRWAVQLMEAVHPAFVHGSGTPAPRMWWKVPPVPDFTCLLQEAHLAH